MSIRIDDLTVTFQNRMKKNKVTAIDHASLEIPGGIYGLLGENGAGKTTLMRVLTTVLAPSGGGTQISGKVRLDGVLYQESNYEKIQRKIGYLPQEIDLYPGLTLQECLEYMGDLSGIPKKECRKRIDEYLEKTSLTEHRNKKMRQLSGGMKRRAGLIQALLNEPEELIQKAEGHVWTCTLEDEREVRALEKNCHISSKQFSAEGMHMRIISRNRADERWEPAEPTLEDAYIWVSNERDLKGDTAEGGLQGEKFFF